MGLVKASQQLDPGGAEAPTAATAFAVVPLIVLMAAQMGTSGDNGALSIATGEITQALGASTSEIQMLNTVYSLVAGACMIVGGMLGTMWGWRRNFRLGAGLAAVGEFAAALAPNVFVLTWCGRLLVGLGASLLIPSVLGLVPKIWHTEQHRAQAYGGVASASGLAILFPIILGILLDLTGFRVTFAILGVYFLLVLAGSLKLPDVDRDRSSMRFDGVGAGLAASGLFLFINGISNLSTWGMWTATAAAPFSVGGLSPAPLFIVVGLILLITLVRVERGIERANGGCLLPHAFLTEPQVLCGLAACTVSFFFMGMQIILVTPYLQVVLGMSALETSGVSIVFGIVMFIASAGIARAFPQLTHKVIMRAGYVAVLASIALLAFSIVPGGLVMPLMVVGFALAGLGAGAVASQAGPVISLALDESGAAQSGGVQATCRNTGQAIAVALLGAVMLSFISSTMTASIAAIDGVSEATAQEVLSTPLQLESDETFLARWENTDAPDHAITEAAARYSDTRVNAIRLSMGVAFVICLAGSLTTSFITKDRSKE